MTIRSTFALCGVLFLASHVSAQQPAPPPQTTLDLATNLFEENDDGPPERWSVSADYLLGWLRGRRLPTLVTTSPVGTSSTVAGVLGQSSTTILFGNSTAGASYRNGFRLGAGGWLDDRGAFGLDAGFFMLESRADLFFASSQDTAILARPFFNVLNNTQASQLVAFPGQSTGSIVASAGSNNLFGANANMKEIIVANTRLRLESLVGYRFLRFDDNLNIRSDLLSQGGGGVAAGSTVTSIDNFTAHNEFHGLDLGVRSEFYWDRFSLGLLTKVAVGNLHRQITIGGATRTVDTAGTVTDSSGGFLALGSNSGLKDSSEWTAVPEVGATLGWNITDTLRLRVGYTFLFVPTVARAADQVDVGLNKNLFPPAQAGASPARPLFELHRSDLWVQNVNLGLEFRY